MIISLLREMLYLLSASFVMKIIDYADFNEGDCLDF